MNRRAFLGLSSAALAAFTLDPERLLWTPGRRTYFDIVRPTIPDSAWGHILWNPEAPEWANLVDYNYTYRLVLPDPKLLGGRVQFVRSLTGVD